MFESDDFSRVIEEIVQYVAENGNFVWINKIFGVND